MPNGKVFIVIGILLLSLTFSFVSAFNIIQDYSFEWNNNTWIAVESTGCIANQSTTAQHYQDAASGETTTTGISISSGSASLTQTMNQLITNFNASNSLYWWALWQANATTGTRDCYTQFTSNTGKNLYYWYNLNKASPSNNPVSYYLTITNPTYQVWNQTQRNFWQDWNQTAGFLDTDNITTVKINCDANYTAATCTGSASACSTWNNSATCLTQYGCSYNTTEYTVNIYPSAAGTHTDFNVQPSSLANWDAVDETPANDSDYVWSITASQNDTYNLQNISIPAGSTINNITVFERAVYYDPTHKAFYITLRTNSVDYNGSKKSGLITYGLFNTTWATNPNTPGFAWTISDINNLEVGARIDTNQGGINISQVYVIIDYTPNTCYDNPGHYSCSITNYPTSSTCTGNLSCAWSAATTFGEQFFWDVFVLNATEDTTPPLPYFGTNPADGTVLNTSSTITFDGKCTDNIGLNSLQIWSNKTGTWGATEIQSSPTNDTWYNISSASWIDGTYKWAVGCNDTNNNFAFTGTNRTFTLNTSTIDSCPVSLSHAGAYHLTKNISTTSTCIYVEADNVDLSCDGYWIIYSSTFSGRGVWVDRKTNFTLHDCTILQNSSETDSPGIYIEPESTNTHLLADVGTVVITNGTNSPAIISYADNLIVDNFIGIAYKNTTEVLKLENSKNIYINRSNFFAYASDSTPCWLLNIINITMNGGYCVGYNVDNSNGLYLSGTNNSLVNLVNIWTYGVSANGVKLDNSNNNTFTNFGSITSPLYSQRLDRLLYLVNSQQNQFISSSFANDYVHNTWLKSEIELSNSPNNNFSNISMNSYPSTHGTLISFNEYSGDVKINSSETQGSMPSGYVDLDKYVKATSTGWLYLKMLYTHADLVNYNITERSLGIWKYFITGAGWQDTGFFNQWGLDVDNNFAYANITSFSNFGLLGEEQYELASPILTFIPPTPNNDTTQNYSYVTVNISSDIALDNATLEWFDTIHSLFINYTMIEENSTIWDYNLTGLNEGIYTYKVYGHSKYDGIWNVTETRKVTYFLYNLFDCLNITSPGSYTLTTNLVSNGTCIFINSDNVNLNCRNYSINYSLLYSGNGIRSNGFKNLTIDNCTIYETNASISNVQGIVLNNTNDTIVANNHCYAVATSNAFGIEIFNSTNASIIDNKFNTNDHCIHFEHVNDSNIQRNNCTNLQNSVEIDYTKNISVFNNVIYTGHANAFSLVFSDNLTLKNNIVFTSSDGVTAILVTNSSFNNNSFSADTIGFVLQNSGYNNITNSDITVTSQMYGIYVEGSIYNYFENITCLNPANVGREIYISEDSIFNKFRNITIGTTYPTTFSFDDYYGKFYIKEVESPPADPPLFYNASKYLNISTTTANAYLDLNISYQSVLNEESLNIMKNNGTWHTNPSEFSNNYGVDIIHNIVYSNITNFGSVFAPLFSIITNVSDCKVLNVPNHIYLLNKSVSSNGTCFTIDAQNVTLDCQGFLINYSTVYMGNAVYDNNFDNATIRNCLVNTGVPQVSASGFDFSNSDNDVLYNNVFTTKGDDSNGIKLTNVTLANISLNNILISINPFNIETYGIYLDNADDITINNNSISTTSVNSSALIAILSSGLIFNTNTFYTLDSNSHDFISYISSGVMSDSNFAGVLGNRNKINSTFNSNTVIDYTDAPAPDPIIYQNISKYINLSGFTTFDLYFFYGNISCVNSSCVNESNLKLMRWDGSIWELINSTVDTVNNYIHSNLNLSSGYGTYAIMEYIGIAKVTDCMNITSPGVYNLQNDIINSPYLICINISSSNVYFNGNIHLISGMSNVDSYGIYASGDLTLTNVTVLNTRLNDWMTGIEYNNVRSGEIDSNSPSCGWGVYLNQSSNISVTRNNVNAGSFEGFYFLNSNNNSIKKNSVSLNGGSGFYFDASSNNDMKNLNSTNNSNGIYLSNDSNFNTLDASTSCFNGVKDIWDNDSNSGDNNVCDNVNNWNDTGTTGCTYSCGGVIPTPNQPTNLNIFSNYDFNDTSWLNWSIVNSINGYYGYFLQNLTNLLLMNESTTPFPNVDLIGENNNTWNDTTNQDINRFYRISAYIGPNQNLTNVTETVGLWHISIQSGEDMFSLPLNQTENITTLIPTTNEFATISDYINGTGWVYSYYFQGHWVLDSRLQSLTIGRGYWTVDFNNEFNITNRGKVPFGIVNQTINIGEGTFGYESMTNEENITTLIPTTNEFATISTFEPGIDGWEYDYYFQGHWVTSGFTSLKPTNGYWSVDFDNETPFSYNRNTY